MVNRILLKLQEKKEYQKERFVKIVNSRDIPPLSAGENVSTAAGMDIDPKCAELKLN